MREPDGYSFSVGDPSLSSKLGCDGAGPHLAVRKTKMSLGTESCLYYSLISSTERILKLALHVTTMYTNVWNRFDTLMHLPVAEILLGRHSGKPCHWPSGPHVTCGGPIRSKPSLQLMPTMSLCLYRSLDPRILPFATVGAEQLITDNKQGHKTLLLLLFVVKNNLHSYLYI